MSSVATDTKGTVIACFRYRNASAAIAWLCDTFGFVPDLVIPDADGTIAHAQLTLGNGMIMLGSVVDSQYNRLITRPDEIGGAETQSAYIIASDPDAIYARAKAAGSRIEIDIKDEAHGGRSFTCRDPEGHLWTIGSFDPWGDR